MLQRRKFLSVLSVGVGVAAIGKAAQAQPSYNAFLDSIREQAIAQGLSSAIVSRALSLSPHPNAKVLQLDRHQPEFTLTWAQYRDRVLPQSRFDKGRQIYAGVQNVMSEESARFGCDDRAVMGIWGLESGFGAHTGTFSVIDALATLSYDGRRSAFFRTELMKALHILNDGDISPEGMMGSYAGAMGQPQFMPSAYLRYAADGDGDGKRNIWTSQADVFASIANYLGKCGWQRNEPWGQEINLTQPFDKSQIGRNQKKTLGEWMSLGVRRSDGQPFGRSDVVGAVLQPDGPGTQAFMVYHNFNVIRRYNPSDYYALGVGLLGTGIVSA
ncbi:lytic murein transglycosylase [Swingsia samuiensis]|uniref:Lytic murein transglycosylase n=1 Tax=Swingsia samuiensis TaxID=1293412 RepID=A0A4Y6UK36_9PROT|nr:lytic murein transglycosylase [Swingsia samuiensis]QDH17922.1 lytic murein transglycosylase [Swingsia samuiensis]